MSFLHKFSRLQWMIIATVILFAVLIGFRKQIFESKLGKAKMEVFKTLLNDSPEEAKENIKVIVDSLLVR